MQSNWSNSILTHKYSIEQGGLWMEREEESFNQMDYISLLDQSLLEGIKGFEWRLSDSLREHSEDTGE